MSLLLSNVCPIEALSYVFTTYVWVCLRLPHQAIVDVAHLFIPLLRPVIRNATLSRRINKMREQSLPERGMPFELRNIIPRSEAFSSKTFRPVGLTRRLSICRYQSLFGRCCRISSTKLGARWRLCAASAGSAAPVRSSQPFPPKTYFWIACVAISRVIDIRVSQSRMNYGSQIV